MMKNHNLYKFFISYIDYKIDKKQISFNYGILMKSSDYYFTEFIDKYKKRNTFKDLINRITLKVERDKKLDSILNGIN